MILQFCGLVSCFILLSIFIQETLLFDGKTGVSFFFRESCGHFLKATSFGWYLAFFFNKLRYTIDVKFGRGWTGLYFSYLSDKGNQSEIW